MQTLVERGCGLDVHQATVVPCLLVICRDGRVQKQLRTFGTTTREWLQLREWLISQSCTSCGNGEHRRLLEAEPAVARSLNSALIGAVATAHETVAVAVVVAFAWHKFAHVSLLPTAQGDYPAQEHPSVRVGSRCSRATSR
jgi:hypothetical protein